MTFENGYIVWFATQISKHNHHHLIYPALPIARTPMKNFPNLQFWCFSISFFWPNVCPCFLKSHREYVLLSTFFKIVHHCMICYQYRYTTSPGKPERIPTYCSCLPPHITFHYEPWFSNIRPTDLLTMGQGANHLNPVSTISKVSPC